MFLGDLSSGAYEEKKKKSIVFKKRGCKCEKVVRCFERNNFLKTNASCQKSNKMASCKDEELAEKVNQFPVLYDKSHSHFHRKDMKSNTWQKVADDLEMVSAEKFNLFVPETAVKMCS